MNDTPLSLLKKYFGYDSFRDAQKKVIDSIINGHDTLAVMPTGAGKSICYQIPALMFDGITIVISPLISLMKDQVDALCNMGIPAAYINSSLSYNDVMERISGAEGGKYKLLYIAPERLEAEDFLQTLKKLSISMLAVDEAHCVSQWGHDFRPSYTKIKDFVKGLNNRPIVSSFTATATLNVRNDISKLLCLKNPDIYVSGFDRENLYFSVLRGENKNNYLLSYIEANKDSSGIIYAATRKEVDSIYDFLTSHNLSAAKYHAGLSDKERKKYQEGFIYDDYKIMTATNAFGMGIDKSNVRYVIHYNMPKNMESYYQEAGRCGRDGEKGDCILLFSPQDVVIQKYLIDVSTDSPKLKNNDYKLLKSMTDYCHTSSCLRKYILNYFGEENAPLNCNNCSSCNDTAEFIDMTTEAYKIFSCVYRVNQNFGTGMIAEILRGSKNSRLLSLKFDKLSTYGIIKEYTVSEIKDIINMLIADEYLTLTEGEYPVVKLLPKAASVIKNKETVSLKFHKKVKKKGADNSLFEALRNLRKTLSEKEAIPPYMIFHDSTLREMSEIMPIDYAMLHKIKGIGDSKMKKYGKVFIDAIINYASTNNIKLVYSTDNTPEKIESLNIYESNNEGTNDDKIKSHIVSYNMYESGKTIDEIAKERHMTKQTIEEHIIRSALDGLNVDLSKFITKEHEKLILDVISRIGASKLKKVKDELPGDINYFMIKVVIAKKQLMEA